VLIALDALNEMNELSVLSVLSHGQKPQRRRAGGGWLRVLRSW
jgi:hypothetical protein